MKKESCPAWGKSCVMCGEKNHFKGSRKCSGSKSVNYVDRDSEGELSEVESVSVVNIHEVGNSNSQAVYCEMLICHVKPEKPVVFQIDCGASVNVLPIKYLPHELHDKICREKNGTLRMWNGKLVNTVGTCLLTMRNIKCGNKLRSSYVIVKEDLIPLISRKTAEGMVLITINYQNFVQSVCEVSVGLCESETDECVESDLSHDYVGQSGLFVSDHGEQTGMPAVTREKLYQSDQLEQPCHVSAVTHEKVRLSLPEMEILKEYPEAFRDEVGDFGKKAKPIKLYLECDAEPKILPARRVAVALKPKVKAKLDEMVRAWQGSGIG